MKIRKKLALFLLRSKLNLLTVINKRKAGKAAFRIFCTPLPAVINKKVTIFDSGEPLEFTVNNTLIKGFRFNHPRKYKVLILHGFSSTCKNFHHYVTAFVNKDYEVLAFDAPAHGMSGAKMVNALDYSRMIQEAAILYGPFDGYMAHSFGGISVCLALEKLPHDENTKLVLIAPATETVSAIDNAFIMLGIKNETLKNALKNEIYAVSGKEATWFSIRRAIKNIKASTLWIHDEDDDTTPLRDALKVKDDHNSNVQFMITKGLGHRKIYRDETVKKAITSFL